METVIGVAIQNNSGGYFIQNESVEAYVAVQAVTEEEAQRRFFEIVAPYSNYCPCCGERWDSLDFHEWPAPERGLVLSDFQDVENEDDVNCILHLADGTKKAVKFVD